MCNNNIYYCVACSLRIPVYSNTLELVSSSLKNTFLLEYLTGYLFLQKFIYYFKDNLESIHSYLYNESMANGRDPY